MVRPEFVACPLPYKQLCGGLTFVHTMPSSEISPSSITSFYEVGLQLGLYDANDLVPFPADEAGSAAPTPLPVPPPPPAAAP